MIDIVNWAKESLRLGNIAFIIAILALGAVLLFVRPRWGRRWIAAVVLAYWFVSAPFGSMLLIAPLVRGFHSIEDPRQAGAAGAIVVLGGGIRDLKARSESLAYPYESTTLRLLEAARVFHLFEGRLLIVTSGGIAQAGQRVSEAAVMADALERLHVPRDRIVLEGSSRTTYEQAVLVTRLLKARGIDRFILVTTPTHMSRAARVFRAQQVDIVPSVSALMPERTRARLFFMPNEDAFDVSNDAAYDYAGLVYYWARGWFRPTPAETDR